MVATSSTLLSDEMLARFAERAPVYDRENRFFQEDFDELKASGYLTAPVPQELGGAGLTLAEMMPLQRRLAYYSAPTALAINMHTYWAGVFADVWRSGDKSVEPFLREIAGEIYAAGHSESGNDLRCSFLRRAPSVSMEATSFTDASRSAAWAQPGRGSAFMQWIRAIPTRQRSSTPSCLAVRKDHPLYPSGTPWPCALHRVMTPSWTAASYQTI